MSAEKRHTRDMHNKEQHLRRRIADLEHELHEAHARLAHMNGARHLPDVPSPEASNTALFALFNGLSDGLLLLDSDGCVLASNDSLAAMVHSTPAALQGRNWHDICQQSNTAMLSTTVQRTRQDGRSHQSREQLPGDMGTSRILDVQTFPLHQQHGPNMILHVVDVTERLNLEAMLVQSERRAAMGSLSATIAHEVNTPLQAIQSLLYLAMRGSDQRTIRHLTRASAQIERINAIFKRLLDLHHVGDMSPTRIDINTIIEHLLDLVRVPLDERHIAVQTHLESSLPRLWGNADKLSQAVLNLLLNAIEAMPNGGTLSLHTSSVPAPQQGNIPATIVVAVRDTGSGIPHDMQQRIFAPFFTTRPGGAGIGLAVSNRIVAEHGGTLSVSSAPNEGSTFTLELPATHPSEPGDNH